MGRPNDEDVPTHRRFAHVAGVHFEDYLLHGKNKESENQT
jgi:hypothetical protein